MNRGDFQRSLRAAGRLLEGLDLLRQWGALTSLDPSEEFRAVSLDAESSYAEIFFTGLRRSEFNFLLTDFSYLQFRTDGEGEVRFAFYPAPFGPREYGEIDKLTALLEGGAVSYEEISEELSSLATPVPRPLVRYEYSEAQYVKFSHPASHVHLGTHSDNRWPVERKLTPAYFSCIVVRAFYKDRWESSGRRYDAVPVDEYPNTNDQLMARERVSCGYTPQQFLHKMERDLILIT